MKVEIVYVYPAAAGVQFELNAWRFFETYCNCPPGCEHSTTIVCNGAASEDERYRLFDLMPDVKFLEHDNSGYDIGGFQHAARVTPCDLMVFFGSSAYLKREGWLRRMVQAYEKHGDALYGSMGNQGNVAVGVYPHIRTTGFWMTPKLFNSYPYQVTKPEQRYPFEHGQNCLTEWCRRKGIKCWVVSWTGEYLFPRWDTIPNGFHNGNQCAMLSGDRVSAPPFYICP